MPDRPLPAPPAAETFAALLIAEPMGRAAAEHAIALTGGRLLAAIGWDAVGETLAQTATRVTLVVETRGVADDVLATALPRIDGYATALDLAIVVALDTAQIDVVAAGLLGAHAELLCDPTTGDRVAALAIAAERGRGHVLHDRVREGEAARLERLNAEVARIAQVLARLTSEPDPPPDDTVADRRQSFALEQIEPVASADEVRRMIRIRRLRDSVFGAGLFEDPAWDMLLDLFAAELERAKVSVSSLCIAAAVAPTTALRWIARMTEAGLFERRPDPRDRRRAFMLLAPRASEAMRRYLAAARRIDRHAVA